MVRMVLSMRCGVEGQKYFYRHIGTLYLAINCYRICNKITMDFIWEGLPNMVREKVGKCSSAKELWDKLHDIYSSPIADSENAKEDADTDQEELCSPCQIDSEDEEYIITRGMLFFFNCEKFLK
jgi:hypothetical protein